MASPEAQRAGRYEQVILIYNDLCGRIILSISRSHFVLCRKKEKVWDLAKDSDVSSLSSPSFSPLSAVAIVVYADLGARAGPGTAALMAAAGSGVKALLSHLFLMADSAVGGRFYISCYFTAWGKNK